MPSSAPGHMPAVVNVVWALAPTSILDIGTGNGKYGALFREYADERLDTEHASFGSARRRTRIDGVEGFAPYIGDLHRTVYDKVYQMLVQDFVARHSDLTYDLIYAGDVVEHFDKDEARTKVLPALIKMARLGLLISVPYDDTKQHALYGNDLELHRSHWTAADFRALAPHSHIGRRSEQLLAFLSNDPACVALVRGKRFKRWAKGIVSAVQESW